MIRTIDHLVLPVAGLDISRSRLRALGFNVAANGIHPFGTANCCVFFQNGPYLEPLAIIDPVVAQQSVEGGNTFVIRDRMFRKSAGDEGLSAIVMQTEDAEADNERFQQDGIAAGSMLEFRRLAEDSQGHVVEAGFRLAFADLQSDSLFAFTCQRIAKLVTDAALQTHKNTAQGVSEIWLSSTTPELSAARLSTLLQCQPVVENERFIFGLSGVHLMICDHEEARSQFGVALPHGEMLSAAAIVFEVADLAALARHLKEHYIHVNSLEGGYLVENGPGQGVAFLFKQAGII